MKPRKLSKNREQSLIKETIIREQIDIYPYIKKYVRKQMELHNKGKSEFWRDLATNHMKQHERD